MTNLTDQIDSITDEFMKLSGSLSTEQLNWKPTPETWSIAQNIDHLIVINKTYFKLLEDLKAGTYQPPFTARIGFLVSFFGKTIFNAVKPDRKKKMKTFTIWEPAKSELPGDIPERFKKHQNELKNLILSSGDLIEEGTIISSPANKCIVYKLETAFNIIVSHEQRHLEQAKEVSENMTGDRSEKSAYTNIL